MENAIDSMRRDARKVFFQSLQAVSSRKVLSSRISIQNQSLRVGRRVYPLSRFKRIFVAGAGKASGAMAADLEKILGSRIEAGWVNVKYGHGRKIRRIQIQECGHPIPDEAGLAGARKIREGISRLREDDLLIVLISGGGSALLPSPGPGITLEEKQATTHALLQCGAAIQEINTIRKHLSLLKGGGLARIAYPATIISLILSDVIGDPLDAIASGPTVPDPTTFEDCAKILSRYKLWGKIPSSVASYMREGVAGKREETLKEGDEAFKKVYNLIVANNLLAMKAAQQAAKALGYHTLILSSLVEGETREVAKVHAAIAKEVLLSGNPIPPPACILSGGETTVTLKGNGKGGRNQEFALAAAMEIAGWREIVILSAGTDGTDGPTDAAGAFADGKTVKRGKRKDLDPWAFLQRNDSFHYFEKIKDLFITGPTGTNVMDLRILLIKKPKEGNKRFFPRNNGKVKRKFRFG
jgi:glycerate 2-kinase